MAGTSQRNRERAQQQQLFREREAVTYEVGQVLQVENGKFVIKVEPLLRGGYRQLSGEVFIHYKGNTITVADDLGDSVIGQLHDTFPTIWVEVPKRHIAKTIETPEDTR